MTKEEKELLLKDLCARLPYHTKIDTGVQGISTLDSSWYEINRMNLEYDSDAFLPYLRPMSSMTEEEREKLCDVCTLYTNDGDASTYEYWGIEIVHNSRYGIVFENNYSAIDWLNEHYFDYRGLIEKGLALEAPDDMYK